jgi:hypothetical protein
MPKYNITFDMDEPFEQEAFKYAHTGLAVRLAVCAFDEKLRQMIKYAPDWFSIDRLEECQNIRDLLHSIFEEHEVDWEVV